VKTLESQKQIAVLYREPKGSSDSTATKKFWRRRPTGFLDSCGTTKIIPLNTDMKSITAYGCSLTAGESIGKDSAWPTQLAHIMGIKSVHNRGIPGASTKQVLHHILHTDPTGLVIIMWPIFSRTGFIEEDNAWHRVMPGVNHLRPEPEPKNTWYYQHLYTEPEHRFQAHQHITLAHHHLRERQCEQHHFTWEFKPSLLYPKPLWNPVQLHTVNYDYTLPLAPDQLHPGVEAQHKMARQMYQKISK